jgi:hypothetical protein
VLLPCAVPVPAKSGKSRKWRSVARYRPSMSSSPASGRICRGTWALPEPSAVWLWRLGLAWSVLVAAVDALTGRGIILSGLVLLGPFCVLFTGRWLRTAVAGAVGICLVLVLGIPDGIWGTSLERFLIGLAVLVAASSTLALIITVRTGLSLMVSASLATACGGSASSSRPAAPATSVMQPVPCRQQYQAWKHGPALAEDKMQAAVSAVQATEESGNAPALRSALKKLVPAALAAAQVPPPRCADPDGLYSEYVTAVYVAGDNARSAEGTSGLLKAAAPLQGLKTIESRLAAEASRAMAKNS